MLIEQLSQTPLLYGIALFVLGLLVGSFLNVVILRLPATIEHQWLTQCHELLDNQPSSNLQTPPPSIAYPPSKCPKCNTKLRWWQNIPVISYLLLKGKCHSCGKPISLRYPLVEILTATLTVIAGYCFPTTTSLPWILLAVWMLIAMSLIDYDTQLLPDILTLPLMWLGFIFSVTPYSLVTPGTAILGAASGYMILWLIYQLHFMLTKRHGMGYGDFKLLAAAGAWLGWQNLPFVLLIAACAGLAITLTLILFRQHNKNHTIPFGPYLAAAFIVILFWGDSLLVSYLNLL